VKLSAAKSGQEAFRGEAVCGYDEHIEIDCPISMCTRTRSKPGRKASRPFPGRPLTPVYINMTTTAIAPNPPAPLKSKTTNPAAAFAKKWTSNPVYVG
jgi:hypothetical protein